VVSSTTFPFLLGLSLDVWQAVIPSTRQLRTDQIISSRRLILLEPLMLIISAVARTIIMPMLSRAQSRSGDSARRRRLKLAHGCHGGDVLAGLLLLLAGALLLVGAAGVGVGEVHVGRGLWVVALRLDQARLQVDDVLAKGVVLGLDGLEVVLEGVQLADLLLEFLDVTLFPLAKGALWEGDMLADWFPRSEV
jgi:hypothetical protein